MNWDIVLRLVSTVVALVVGLSEEPKDKSATGAALRALAQRLIDKAETLDEDQAEDQRILDSRIAKSGA